MKYRQKIDKEASDQLERILGTFPKAWGCTEEHGGKGNYRFNGFADSDDAYVAYDAKKQLLGGVYSLVFSLTRENIITDAEGEVLLHYKGHMLKGEAYFAAKKRSEGTLSEKLNGQKELIKLLSELDLLSMTVSVSKGTLNVKLSPLGGAFTYTVFPPMKYGSLLPDTHLERIRQALMIFAAEFPKADVRQAAGAE